MIERFGKPLDFVNDPWRLALEYASRWPVLPLAWVTDEGSCGCSTGDDCHRAGKHPLCSSGVHSATQDAATIKGWWAMWPQANIGIRTGRESGLLVLDVDPQNGDSESLEQLQDRYGKLQATLVCSTGGGGWHFYLQYPGLAQWKGKVPGYSGLDIKADGGYVVGPPSQHISGRNYRWQTDWRTTAIAPVPEWLLELIRTEEEVSGRQTNSSGRGLTLELPQAELTPEDLKIIRQLKAGRYGELYRLLFIGDIEGAGLFRNGGSYRSASEADLAMFNLLARLTAGDPGRMYAVFGQSGLVRDKAIDHPTYLALTIHKAIAGLGW